MSFRKKLDGNRIVRYYLRTLRCASLRLFYEHPVMALKVRATPTEALLTFFSESVKLKHDQASRRSLGGCLKVSREKSI